jgi:thiamine-phosphate pyrophosphorylase
VEPPRLICITATDLIAEAELFDRLERARRLAIDVRQRLAVQLRDPHLSGQDLWRLAEALRARTRALGMSLIVNDRLDVAAAIGADGVHLGRRSVGIADARSLLGPATWVSVSAHSIADVRAGADAGASAVMLSPVFDSPGKGPALGADALREARRLIDARAVRPWLIALGGIDAGRAAQALDAGADGVAAIRADLLQHASALVRA